MKSDRTRLIPRRVLFGNPDRAGVRLSPDGENICFIAPLDGVLNVWVARCDAVDEAVPVTNDTGRGIRFAAWTHMPGMLLYLQDTNGDENWHLFVVDVVKKKVTDLTPGENVQARLYGASPERPGEILVGLNERDQRFHDLYIIELQSTERQLLLQNDRFVGFVVDREFNVHFAAEATPDGGSITYARRGDEWTPVHEVSMEDALTTGAIGLTHDAATLYMLDSRGRDTSALVARDVATGQEDVLFATELADVDGVLREPRTGIVQGARYEHERRVWHLLDERLEADFAYLAGVADGEMDITSRSLDDAYWVVHYVMDTGPVRYYLYDRARKTARFLFTNRQALENQPLAPMHPVTISARDGLPLVSYLTLPLESDPEATGVPGQPLPLVLVVHGGPWARDNWGYNAIHQWLANRGYAVLSVNYRGSTGFGKAFINAGNKQWGAKMHDDLLDAVAWAIDQGIAAPEKVAIFGGSYGGYAALAGLTFSPDVFAAAVDIVGPSNLVTLLESVPPYWEPMLAQFITRVGDHRTEEGREFLRSRSPLSYVERIVKPLLIAQGANDPRVKQAESDQIVAAMEERSIPVTYALYPDEGHGFARPENNLSFYAIAEGFLAQHIGGAQEVIGDDFIGSSVQLLSGADAVPGVKDALAQM